MKRHEWRERQTDGEVMIFRATKHGALWTLSTRLKTEEEWKRHDPLEKKDLLVLKEMLERKYQRNRVPYKDLEKIEQMLED
jgi:hypothetical protein